MSAGENEPHLVTKSDNKCLPRSCSGHGDATLYVITAFHLASVCRQEYAKITRRNL